VKVSYFMIYSYLSGSTVTILLNKQRDSRAGSRDLLLAANVFFFVCEFPYTLLSARCPFFRISHMSQERTLVQRQFDEALRHCLSGGFGHDPRWLTQQFVYLVTVGLFLLFVIWLFDNLTSSSLSS
jgi:hypothetical protein